jgi:two-component system, NarL family, nitrate/nitrite response regulator NarL
VLLSATELRSWTGKGTEFLNRLREMHFDGKVLLVTADVSDAELYSLIRKAISGVFMKHGSPALLVQGIRKTMEGTALFEPDQLRRAFEGAKMLSAEQRRSNLSERERQTLSFVLDGLGNRQIAGRLQIFRDRSQSLPAAAVQQDWG